MFLYRLNKFEVKYKPEISFTVEMMVEISFDLWQYLANDKKPIVVYGMGDGADKLIRALERIGREPEDYFASDGFVRGQFFHGKQVLSFDDIRKKHSEFVVLVSFGTQIPDVIDNICKIESEFELYAPDLPVCPGELFTYDFYSLHKDEFEFARSLLYDDISKKEFDDVLNYKLSGKIKYIKFSQSSQFSIAKSQLRCYNYKSYVDGGAYNGDTILQMCSLCPSLSKVYAFEPDARSFRKMDKTLTDTKVSVIKRNAALGNSDGECTIYEKGNRNTSLYGEKATDAVKKTISVCKLDTVLDGEGVDFIKLDVEGAELDAISGAENTIGIYQPDMQISLYHRPEDMFTIIPKVYSMYASPRISVRKTRYIPAWDFNMYLVND